MAWSTGAQTYDRSPGDEIKIQTDIAINVAQALSVALGRAWRSGACNGWKRRQRRS